MKETLYTAVDVGTTKVATLVGRVPADGTMEIVAAGHAASEGMKKGMVVGTEELSGAVRRSVGEAASMLGRKLPPVYAGITGSHLTCINAAAQIDQEPGRRGQAFSQEDIDRLLRSTFPQVTPHRKIMHIVPRTYQVDGLAGVTSPVGMKGRRLWAESHVVLGDQAPMENLGRALRGAGVKVRGMVIEHLASAEAVLTPEEREIGAVLVDIGGGTSDIAIYKDGAVWYTAAVPIAGFQFTNDVAVGLGLPPSVAEAAKVEHGSAIVEGVNQRETVEIDAGTGGDTRSISRAALNTLLHDRAVELVRVILHKVRQSGLTRVPPGGIVLTGGTAEMPGLAEIAADYGECRVRVGSPVASRGLPPELEKSSFSTAVGLLVWAVQNRHAGAVAADIAVAPPVMDRVRGWLARIGIGRPSEVRV